MYVKEYLCKCCLEFRTIEFFENEHNDFCVGCSNEDLCYCPGCDQHLEIEFFSEDCSLCLDCTGEDEKEVVVEDPWSVALDTWKEIAKGCHGKNCLWINDNLDDKDYFFAPSCRFHPHALCKT